MERFVGKIAVVTGSSSGIGLAVSKLLAKHGMCVAGLARRKEKLQELSGEISNSTEYKGSFFSVECDVTKEQDILRAFEIIKRKGPISVLVNNAGTLRATTLLDIQGEQIDATFDTNVKGLLLCAKKAMESMLDNSIPGHIINVNSIAGQVLLSTEGSVNDIVLYTASKFAARIASEGLRQEIVLRKAQIKITNLCPGLVKTELAAEFISDKMSELHVIQAEDVADACYAVLNTPPNVLSAMMSRNRKTAEKLAYSMQTAHSMQTDAALGGNHVEIKYVNPAKKGRSGYTKKIYPNLQLFQFINVLPSEKSTHKRSFIINLDDV